MAWNTFPLELIEAQDIAPGIVHLVFGHHGETPFEFTAGQFLNIHFEADGKAVHRSYSIANPPEPTNERLEIAVQGIEGGRATRLLFGLKPGDRIDVSGPYGRFVLRDEQPARLILVATGTGVTPYRSMLPELDRRLAQQDLEIELLLGVRNRAECLYAREFVDFARRHANFRFRACYSREEPDETVEYEHKGYVQTHFEELSLNPEGDIVYLCGNPNMIDEAFAQLREKGFSTRAIRREKYLPARN